MGDIIALNKFENSQQGLVPLLSAEANGLISITDDVLLDVRSDISKCNKISVPIAQLSTLGAGVASMLPTFRTITQSASVAGEPLYRVANQAIGDSLKIAKDGNAWGAMKTSSGTSKMVKLQQVGDIKTVIFDSKLNDK